MKTLTVIAPAYNEEEVIVDFYREVRAELDKLKDYQSNILIVVDRGRDRTLEILAQLAKKDSNLRALGLSAHFGHQMQLLAGIDYAQSDVVVMMDSDLQHPPQVIPKLLAEYEKGNDIVYTIRERAADVGLIRAWASDIFYWFLNKISDVPINQNAADFRLISRRVAEILQRQIRERNLFLRGLVGWLGFNQAAVRFVANPRRAGKSKYSFRRLVRLALSGVVSFSRKPLRLASLVGIIFALFGFLYALITIVQFFFDKTLPAGWATVVVLLSIFGGLQLIFLGIIGEYIGAIFDEVKRRPHYIIDQKINF